MGNVSKYRVIIYKIELILIFILLLRSSSLSVLSLMPKLSSSTSLHTRKFILVPFTTYIEWLFIHWFGLSIALIESDLIEYSREWEERSEECHIGCCPIDLKEVD